MAQLSKPTMLDPLLPLGLPVATTETFRRRHSQCWRLWAQTPPKSACNTPTPSREAAVTQEPLAEDCWAHAGWWVAGRGGTREFAERTLTHLSFPGQSPPGTQQLVGSRQGAGANKPAGRPGLRGGGAGHPGGRAPHKQRGRSGLCCGKIGVARVSWCRWGWEQGGLGQGPSLPHGHVAA